MSDDREYSRGVRNAWILAALGLLYIASFLFLAMWTNRPEQPRRWDMDGTPFVPASSDESEDWYGTVGGNPADVIREEDGRP